MTDCKSCANKDAIIATLRRDLEAPLLKYQRARPESEWHENHGNVLWWHFPVEECPYIGMPIDSDWDGHDEGYYTHFTPLIIPTGVA